MDIIETIILFLVRYALYGRFILVGSAGVLVQVGVLDYVHDYLGRWYMEGVVLGYLLSVLVMFFLEKVWVFHDRSHDHTSKEFVLFMIVSTAALGETMILMYILVDLLHQWPTSSQLFAAMIVLATTYSLNRRYTFHVTKRRVKKHALHHRHKK